MSDARSEAGAPARPDVRITAGDPTPEEIAALSAVLAAAFDEIAAEHRRDDEQTVSAWDRSRRAPRRGVTPGAWVTWGR